MSAFMCSNNHINIMLNHTLALAGSGKRWLRSGPSGPGDNMVAIKISTQDPTFDDIGRGLLMLNARSVYARYGDKQAWGDMLEQANSFRFVRLSGDHTFCAEDGTPGEHRVNSPWAMMQLCRCLEYQSNEAVGWKSTWSGINLRDMHFSAMQDWLKENKLFDSDDDIPGREWLWSI